MTYEIGYVDKFQDDLDDAKLSDDEARKIHQRLENIASNKSPILMTERLLNTPCRKIPYKNFRIFLYIQDTQEIIYVLGLRHHNQCYSTKSINQIISRIPKPK
jgi:mRNA-degrading endonuclease RelE of RelBE toxin-antitoxin system